MAERQREKVFYSPIKQKFLLLLLAGVALGLSRSYRHQRYVLRSLRKEWKKIDRAYLYRILREFRDERLVNYRENSDGTIEVVLTEAGKKRALRFNLDCLTIKQSAGWDGYWRIVIFDIPERKRRARDALRLKLKELGFYEWQKSVLIYPYSCRNEIDFIVEFFGLRPYVRYAELRRPTNEAELKLHFSL